MIRPRPTYLLGLDSIPISAEKSLYDLAEWTRTHDWAGGIPVAHADAVADRRPTRSDATEHRRG